MHSDVNAFTRLSVRYSSVSGTMRIAWPLSLIAYASIFLERYADANTMTATARTAFAITDQTATDDKKRTCVFEEPHQLRGDLPSGQGTLVLELGTENLNHSMAHHCQPLPASLATHTCALPKRTDEPGSHRMSTLSRIPDCG